MGSERTPQPVKCWFFGHPLGRLKWPSIMYGEVARRGQGFECSEIKGAFACTALECRMYALSYFMFSILSGNLGKFVLIKDGILCCLKNNWRNSVLA